jgi:hypothetical protein
VARGTEGRWSSPRVVQSSTLFQARWPTLVVSGTTNVSVVFLSYFFIRSSKPEGGPSSPVCGGIGRNSAFRMIALS